MPLLRALPLLTACLLACAARRTPDQLALMGRKDCKELLLAADQARVAGDKGLARDLAQACPQAGLDALAANAGAPAASLLWCGRARAALTDRSDKPSCAGEKVIGWMQELKPALTLGPADPAADRDPLLIAGIAAVGQELHLGYDHDDPVVYIGQIRVTIDRSDQDTLTRAPDPNGKKHQIAAQLHRLAARAEAQVEIGSKTRTMHASEESKDVTWAAEPRFAIPARFEPQLAEEEELKMRAVKSLLRTIARSLASSPPEAIETDDAPGCMAYGIAIAAATGDRTSAANRIGDEEKLDACEKILGVVEGGGIPVP